MERLAEDKINRPDALILLVHRHIWQPARYAHPDWFTTLGFYRHAQWRYGEFPFLDQSLNRALRARFGTFTLPEQLDERQRRLVRLAPNMTTYALILGLLTLECGDYFLLPDYRKVLCHWLDNELLWRLFGICNNKGSAVFSPANLIDTANRIGIAMLYRAAKCEPVLQALLIRLPPPRHALYPVIPRATMNLLERMLCHSVNSR